MIIKITTYVDITGKDLDVDLAKEALESLFLLVLKEKLSNKDSTTILSTEEFEQFNVLKLSKVEDFSVLSHRQVIDKLR